VFNKDIIDSFKTIETPFYYYDLDILLKTLERLIIEANSKIFKVHYAVKANTNSKILNCIRSYGLGIDAVSGNEVKKVIEEGFDNENIVFAGVGKTDKEIEYAINSKISCFNCESIQEIQVINDISKKLSVKSNISLRLNPNIESRTHKNITTGTKKNKFGIDIDDVDDILTLLKSLDYINLIGIHFHLGSQITNFKVFDELSKIANITNKKIYDYGILLNHINVGGGLPIDYNNPEKNYIPNFSEYFNIYKKNIILLKNQKIFVELGRSLVGQCGNLISRVLFTKNSYDKNYVILDAGMTELIRPALYNSYHKISNLTFTENKFKKYDVVGPLCESSDIFLKNIKLPFSKRDDIFRIYSCGAYGETMSSNYNLRNSIKSYYSDMI